MTFRSNANMPLQLPAGISSRKNQRLAVAMLIGKRRLLNTLSVSDPRRSFRLQRRELRMKEPSTTPQELGRNPNIQIAGEEGPSAEFLAAFKAQATQDMMDDVVAYIAKRATWLRHQ